MKPLAFVGPSAQRVLEVGLVLAGFASTEGSPGGARTIHHVDRQSVAAERIERIGARAAARRAKHRQRCRARKQQSGRAIEQRFAVVDPDSGAADAFTQTGRRRHGQPHARDQAVRHRLVFPPLDGVVMQVNGAYSQPGIAISIAQ